jgi:WS/DGAT/MGAT family acyltransferase
MWKKDGMMFGFGKNHTMEALSGLDAAFLYMETPTSPMHIGSLAVLEGSLQFEDFRELLQARLHLVKSFRQRLVEVPFHLDRPYWADDPHFNIDWHLHHTALPRPGGWRQLRKLCSRIFSQPLDRTRPLWEIVFVEGLDAVPQVPPGSVALISKVHHCAVDGVSGADIMGALFDLSPEPRDVPAPPSEATPPLPGDVELLARTSLELVRRPLRVVGLAKDLAKATVKTGVVSQAKGMGAPTMPFQAPRTPLNGSVSSNRVWNTALLQLDRIKRLKKIMNCTVNDVVLAICAGALRRYLQGRDALPDKPLVTMCPISVRAEEQRGAMGNQVSAMFVQLATNIEDPIERLRQLQKNTTQGKTYQHAIGANALMETSELIPFGLAGRAARMYARSELAPKHRPIINCVITNVPGPQVPLYLGGHRLLANMGMAPIIDGMGLIITVFSYNGVVSLSSISCPQMMPDIDVFTRYIWESANELEACILALDIAKEAEEDKPAVDIRTVFQALQGHLKDNPDMSFPAKGVYQFDVVGEQEQSWVFDLQATPAAIDEGGREDAMCTLKMSAPHIASMVTGELDGTAAFMQGKLKVEGDIGAAIQFGKVLASFPKEALVQA